MSCWTAPRLGANLLKRAAAIDIFYPKALSVLAELVQQHREGLNRALTAPAVRFVIFIRQRRRTSSNLNTNYTLNLQICFLLVLGALQIRLPTGAHQQMFSRYGNPNETVSDQANDCSSRISQNLSSRIGAKVHGSVVFTSINFEAIVDWV
jgi:hypothetical protein